MSSILFSVLFICSGAVAGWLISRFFIWLLFRPQIPQKFAGISITGILPSLKPVLVEKSIKLSESLDLKKMVSGKITLDKIMPEIEIHVDEFLKVRLKEAFPLLYNFMGQKTLSKFKETFMEEVSSKLPGLLENYAGKIADEFDLKQLISQKIESINLTELESAIKEKAKKQLILLQVTGLILGTVFACCQLLLIKLLQ